MSAVVVNIVTSQHWMGGWIKFSNTSEEEKEPDKV